MLTSRGRQNPRRSLHISLVQIRAGFHVIKPLAAAAMLYDCGMSTTIAPGLSRPTRPAFGWVAAWAIVGAGAVAPRRVSASLFGRSGPTWAIDFSFLSHRLFSSTSFAHDGEQPRGHRLGPACSPLPRRRDIRAAWYLLVQVGPRTLLLWWLATAWLLAAIGLTAIGHGWRPWNHLVSTAFRVFRTANTGHIAGVVARQVERINDRGSGGGLALARSAGDAVGRRVHVDPAVRKARRRGCVQRHSIAHVAPGDRRATGYVRMTFRRDFTISRIVALVVLAIPIVVVSQHRGVIASAMLQENLGPGAIQGLWHEILGYLVILIGFALIVGVSQKIATRRDEQGSLLADPVFPVDAEAARERGEYGSQSVFLCPPPPYASGPNDFANSLPKWPT